MMHHDLQQIRDSFVAAEEEFEDLGKLFPPASPPQLSYFRFTASLDERQKKLQSAFPAVENKADKHASAAKIIAFAKAEDAQIFKFIKEKVPNTAEVVNSSSSGLALSLLEGPKRPGGPKGGGSWKTSENIPALHLVVFIMINAGPLPNKVNVKIVANATVEQLIDVVVRQLNILLEKTKSEDATGSPINSKSCQLMLAEDDGRPDTDTPVLQRDSEIHRFGSSAFALCRDPDYNSGEATPTVKIILPSKEYQVLSVTSTTSLRHVLDKVCKKRLLEPSIHYLASSKDPNGPELDLDRIMGDLDCNEVVMRCKTHRRPSRLHPPIRSHTKTKSRGDMLDSISEISRSYSPQAVHTKVAQKLGLPQQFFFSPAIVAQHEQYRVVKINKYKKRQARLMGIDTERITNCMPPDVKAGKTHTPFRLINTVIRAYVIDRAAPWTSLGGNGGSGGGSGGGTLSRERKPFCIEYLDAACFYESDKAEEIVARINFILSMDRDAQKRRDSH